MNHTAIIARREKVNAVSHLSGLTSFRDSPELSPADLAASMIGTIELHHGAYSHERPFSRLTVIGASDASPLVKDLQEISFQLMSASDSILEFAMKDQPNQSRQPTSNRG